MEWENSWKSAWTGITSQPLPPQEMSSWLQKRGEILALLETLRENELHLKDIQQQIQDAKMSLLRVIEAIAGKTVKESNALKAVLMQGRTLRDKILADNQRRNADEGDLAKQQRASEEAKLQIAAAEKAL